VFCVPFFLLFVSIIFVCWFFVVSINYNWDMIAKPVFYLLNMPLQSYLFMCNTGGQQQWGLVQCQEIAGASPHTDQFQGMGIRRNYQNRFIYHVLMVKLITNQH